MPAVPTTDLHAGRLSVSDSDWRGAGCRGRGKGNESVGGRSDVRTRYATRMTTAAISVTHPRTVPGVERLTVALLLCFVASLQISIAAANILLALMLVCWVGTIAQERTFPSVPPFFLPIAVYAGATLLVSIFSIDPRESFTDDKQLVLFLIVPAVYHIARGERAATVVDVIVSVGALSA